MAMIKCRECGKDVSDQAASCPNCGCPIQINNYPQQSNYNGVSSTNTSNQTMNYGQPQQNIYNQPAQNGYYNSQYNKNIPYNSSPNARTEKKKNGIGQAFVFVSLVLLAFLFFVMSLNSAKKSNKNANSVTNNSSKNDNQTESESITTSKPQEETKDRYYVGDTWENKYVLISYEECGEYISDNYFMQPEEGKKYIYASFTFENIGNSDTTVAYWDFDCYADGYACDDTYVADDAAFSQTLSSGRKISGSVYYEVPIDALEIEFEYSPSFWTSEKIVFVYE